MDLDTRWRHPFTAILSGPSKCGKSTFVFRFLKDVDSMMSLPPEQILFCYSEYQPGYDQLLEDKRVQLIDGLPQIQELRNNTPKLIILDDLGHQLAKSEDLNTLFTRASHHWSLSVFLLLQNLFIPGIRNSRLNADYLTLFRSPSDKSQVSTLARQLYPQNQKFFHESHADATSKPYQYIVVDQTQQTDDSMRLRSLIFPDDIEMVYQPR